jgi:hypothetical protein
MEECNHRILMLPLPAKVNRGITPECNHSIQMLPLPAKVNRVHNVQEHKRNTTVFTTSMSGNIKGTPVFTTSMSGNITPQSLPPLPFWSYAPIYFSWK